MELIVKAPAKINLFLEISGKRPNGYHNLQTIMQTVNLCDELTFELTGTGSISLSVIGPYAQSLPSDDGNIIIRAAKMLKEKYNVKQGAKIILQKNIPTEAGLGGGSSDAAATLLTLARLWNIKITRGELENIAISLGADVPFFLTGGAVLCEGIGEKTSSLFPPVYRKEGERFLISVISENPLKEFVVGIHDARYFPLSVVLVNPNFSVSTAAVYQKVKLPFTNPQKIDKIKNLVENGSLNFTNAHEFCFNRLEDFVLCDYPEIEDIKQFLTKIGCIALMSGSGPTVFGIYDPENKDKIETELKKHSWKYWFVKTI